MWEFRHFKSQDDVPTDAFILNPKPENVGVPTNYVSLRSFCRFERIFYNEVCV
ncbi:hypothetical protein LEP1GSC005_2852 [Leptospira santarosai str. ST188]|nr:hypothetical protein LEP1GSC005_2852 [Leptospira santarosai str. ST188]EMO70569.1 hypothetical protein LEP1GSC130_3467 [Leptospira santarosai str. 200403458]EMO96932.1 hypothetical protein LEP1GSC120_0122 [Leptospira santarosai str. 200702252]